MEKLIKQLFFISLILGFLGLSQSCSKDNDDDTQIDPTELPQAARTFVATHFEGLTIVKAEKDNNASANGSIYEVKLSNGTEVDFDINGEWTEVDCQTEAIPASIMALVPENISVYPSQKYPNSPIVQLEKEVSGYSIELTSGLDIYFDKEGNWLSEKY